MTRFIAIILCALLCMGCKQDSANMSIGFKAILGWLLPELTNPSTLIALADKSDDEKVDYIVALAEGRITGLTRELRSAIKAGDTAALRSWCSYNLPDLLPLIGDGPGQYSPQRILGFCKKVSPRLGETIELASPPILAYLHSKGAIEQPDWASVAGAYKRGFSPTDTELADLADLLTAKWIEAGKVEIEP